MAQTNQERHDPLSRPFQKRVFHHMMHGENVILQAPTGSGKTRAALAPFLQNLAQNGNALPLTCRYAVPLRVLANQFFHEYDAVVRLIDQRASTRLDELYRYSGCQAVAIQTGEQPDDPQFESALTFCTIDQLLASFLAVPYGLGSRLANLNVAGVAGSYLVLDEFHLYPLLRDGQSVFGARTTAMQMLRLLKATTPFILMTATFSTTLLDRLSELLGAVVVKVEDKEELREIADGRMRTFWRAQEPMDALTLLHEHQQRKQNKCTLVVCNSVLRAQRLFVQLQHAEEQGTRVVLLHSRFSEEDRRRLSEEIEHELGPAQWKDGIYHGRDILVIATQVIEVGLNISAQVLHTENAPASSLIQRAGRCARFAHQRGDVYVYPLPVDEEGKEANTLPYDKELCASTWEALAQFHGQEVGFLEEQKLINDVHTAEDEDLLRRYAMYEGELVTQIVTSLNTNGRESTSKLIRDVSQVQILIHNDPDTAITEQPWRWQSFSMHPGSLTSRKRWDALQQRTEHPDWAFKEAIPIPMADQEPDGADGLSNRQKTLYQWVPVASPEAVSRALIIALPSRLARYDGALGFVLLDGQLDIAANDYQSARLPDPSSGANWDGSRVMSYQQHISGLVSAYKNGVHANLRYISSKLEQAFEFPTGIIDQAVRLAIACHDLGKLDQQWQQWALNWQTLLYEKRGWPAYQPSAPDFCFAKTDNDYSLRYREWQREVTPKRPRHACESVAIGREFIGNSLGIMNGGHREYIPVLRAICGAIARHHTSQASTYSTAKLDSRALKAASEALHIAHENSSWRYDPSLLRAEVAQGDDLIATAASRSKLTQPALSEGQRDVLETWLYFVIVRALRLCDQRADRFS